MYRCLCASGGCGWMSAYWCDKDMHVYAYIICVELASNMTKYCMYTFG